MSDIHEGDLLWEPSAEMIATANLTHYMQWLASKRNLTFHTYHDLWHWSVHDVADFWQSIWDYAELKASAPPAQILPERTMPGAKWFVGAKLNYAENLLARMTHERPMMLYKAEEQPLREVSWQEVYDQTCALAQVLRALGVQPGDRVVAYMPAIPETIVALLAVASLGAVWSSCSPDFGSRSVLDRFQQIEPKVLIAVDGYDYNGQLFDRRQAVAELQAGLSTLEQTILVPLVTDGSNLTAWRQTVRWDEVCGGIGTPPPLQFEQVAFDHPLWVVYTSGTTGLPKPIVQGHGGILLEHFKAAVLHFDLKPSDRFFWYSSTGWVMWNIVIGGLLSGCTIVMYNGSPGYPDMEALWALAEEAGITYFGTSAAYISTCIKAAIAPAQTYDLSRIRTVGCTGSPLSLDGFKWIYDHVNRTLSLQSTSGGTDVCTAFVGGCRLLPVYAEEIQAPFLGVKVSAFNDDGQPVLDEVGELVITEPMPSMPLYFWHDTASQRYKASYFDTFPGIWRHGDWVKFNQRGGCVIYGRSDATINRQGVRMGTSEIYRAVEALPEVVDSLIVDLELLGRESYMPLFVVLREDVVLDARLQQRIKQHIRQEISPRHVPNDIFVTPAVPYTLTGKKMEIPVRRILLGHPVEKAATSGAMQNPEAIAFFVQLAARLNVGEVTGHRRPL
jgi:acetoacetyl-CoA synthetase